MTLSDLTVGYALCGSFCTFEKAIAQMRALKEQGPQCCRLCRKTLAILIPVLAVPAILSGK